jgi:hypothetical protein
VATYPARRDTHGIGVSGADSKQRTARWFWFIPTKTVPAFAPLVGEVRCGSLSGLSYQLSEEHGETPQRKGGSVLETATLTGTLVGSDPPPDRFDTRNNAVAPGEGAELELQKFILKRASANGESETPEQREERRYKERRKQREAEEAHYTAHSRRVWLIHLKKVYTSRLREVDGKLAEIERVA